MKRWLLMPWSFVAAPSTFAATLSSGSTPAMLVLLILSALLMAPFQVLAYMYGGLIPKEGFKFNLIMTLVANPVHWLVTATCFTLLFWLTTLVLGARSGFRLGLRGYAATSSLGILFAPFCLLLRVHVGAAVGGLVVTALLIAIGQWRVMNRVAQAALGLSRRRSVVAASVPYAVMGFFFMLLVMTLSGRSPRAEVTSPEPPSTIRKR